MASSPKSAANDSPAPRMNAITVVRMLAGMLSRSTLGRLTSFGGARDYNNIFGWDNTITPEAMRTMYHRGGIAKRVVDSYPDAVWSRPPVLWAEGDDAWTEEWAALTLQLNLWTALHRLDKLAALGQYSILLVGTDKARLEAPLVNPKRITFLQPYGQTSTRINTYNRDVTSENFGKPAVYQVNPDLNVGFTARGSSGSEEVGPTRTSFMVDSSRVLHIARNPLEDEVFGQPMMGPCWDYLTDLRKVVGSSSESYWISANRGLQADVDKEMALNAEDAAALQDEVEEFYNGFRRFIRTRGVKMNALTNDIADPLSAFNVLITLISGTSGIPKRILLGSEAGQLASTQDKGNWAERVEENRALHAEPRIVRPFVLFCIKNGIIRPPSDPTKLRILWPDAYRMSPLERGQTQAQTARSIANVTKMFESESEAARTLLSRDEARALLGFSSDNRILEDEPNP